MSLTLIYPRFVKFVVGLLLLIGLAAMSASARAATGDLLAVGAGEDGLWLAQVQTDPAHPDKPVTYIRFRGKSVETWADIASVNGRVISMAPRGEQLAVLQESGEWMFVWAGGSALGQPLPMKGKIRALAGDGETIWALAAVTGEMPATKPAVEDEDLAARLAARLPATNPTTGPTTVPTATLTKGGIGGPVERESKTVTMTALPSTTKSKAEPEVEDNPRWIIFRLTSAGWQPGEQIAAPFDLKVAAAGDQGKVLVAMARDGQFVNTGLLLPPIDKYAKPEFSILTGDGPTLFWIATAPDAGSIVPIGVGPQDKNSQTQPFPAFPLAKPKGMPVNSDRAIAVSTGRLRLLFTKPDQGKIVVFEQMYDMKTLKAVDAPSQLVFSVAPVDSVFQTVLSAIVMASLIFAMVVSFQNRLGVRELFEQADAPQPAPLTTRLIAGAIDMLPIFAAMVVIRMVVPISPDPTVMMQDSKLNMILWIGVAVYVLHTTVIEALTGATIGKKLLGLKVIGLDGQPAKVGPRVTRNLLRVVDLMLFGLMIFSPYRQRVGDIVAGTLVVSSKVKVPDETEVKP